MKIILPLNAINALKLVLKDETETKLQVFLENFDKM